MPENDKLTTTLDALRSDIERTPMADSLAVRRRGDQRTRRQAVGGALAVVALVAGAAGLYGGVGGLDRADAPPATDNPTASTEVEQPLELAADPFLRDADIGEVGPYTLQRSPDSPESADAVNQKKLQCMPAIASLGAAQTEGQYFYSDLDASFAEQVLRFDDAAAAAAAAEALDQAFQSCPEGDPTESTVVDRAPEAVGASGLRASRLSTPTAASEPFYYELGLVQRQNVLVVLQWTSMGNPVEDSETETWVWTADRLGTALDRAIA